MSEIPEGDYEIGKRLFMQLCRQCHTAESKYTRAGPSLQGIIGRKAGSVPGYIYTRANKNKNIIWTRETLSEFLLEPRKFMPGTKMIFAGLKNAEYRAHIIKYLEKQSKM